MSLLNKYTLRISNPSLSREYLESHNTRIFITGIVLTVLRLARISFSTIVPDAKEPNDFLEEENDLLKWITIGIQLLIVLMQKIYPQQLNTIAIPLWIIIANSTVKISYDDPYPTVVFLFK